MDENNIELDNDLEEALNGESDDELEIDESEELDEGSEDKNDEGVSGDGDSDSEEEDPFAALYEDDEENSEEELDEESENDEEELGADNDGEGDKGKTSKEEPKNEKYDALTEKLRSTLKKLGYDNPDEAPEELLDRLAAEADGVSKERFEAERAFAKKTADDLAAIHAAYPETKKYKSWKEFPNHVKFAHLMDNKEAKLSAVEAFSAAHPDIVSAHVAGANRAKNLAGTKSHLTSSVPKGAKDTGSKMTRSELNYYRELLPDATDEEIKKIYKRIT